MRWPAGMGLGCSCGSCKTSPSQRGDRVGCGAEGLWVLLRKEEGVWGSGRQVAGMRVAGDLACACPGQLGQAAGPCLCFSHLAFPPSPPLAFFFFYIFPNCCFFFSPSFYLAFLSNLRHV